MAIYSPLQPLKIHTQPKRMTTGPVIGQSLHLLPYFMYLIREGLLDPSLLAYVTNTRMAYGGANDDDIKMK